MSLRQYTMNRILSRLSAQDREEMLERQRAQRDAANRVATLQAIERLTGIAGQLPDALSSSVGAGFGDAAELVGPGERIEGMVIPEQIDAAGKASTGAATPTVPKIEFIKEPPMGQTPAPSGGILPKTFNVAQTEEDFRKSVASPAAMPNYRTPTRTDLDMTPASIPTLPDGSALQNTPTKPASPVARLAAQPAPKKEYLGDYGFFKTPGETHSAFLARLDKAVAEQKLTPWQAAEIVGKMPTEHTTFPATDINAELTTIPNSAKPKAAPTPAAKPAAKPQAKQIQKARLPGEDDIAYGNRLNQMVINGDIDQFEYAELWKNKDKPQADTWEFSAEDLQEPIETVKVRQMVPGEEAPQKTDEEDPIVEPTRQEARAQTVAARKYTPLKWKRSETEEAEAQLDEILRLGKPHPLLNILSFGMANNRYEIAKRVALKQAAKAIRQERRLAEQDNLARFKAEAPRSVAGGKTAEQIAAEIALKEAQKELIEKRTLDVGINKRQTPTPALAELKNLDETRTILEDIEGLAIDIAGKTGTLPIGVKRFVTKAMIDKIAADTGATSEQVAAGLGASIIGTGGNASVQFGRGVSGQRIDPELANRVFDALDAANLSPEEQQFLLLQRQSIQLVGKAREGGRMTDADYNKYMQTLYSGTSPQTFMASLRDIQKKIGTRLNRDINYYSNEYGDNINKYFSPWEPREDTIDWSKIKEKELKLTTPEDRAALERAESLKVDKPKPSPGSAGIDEVEAAAARLTGDKTAPPKAAPTPSKPAGKTKPGQLPAGFKISKTKPNVAINPQTFQKAVKNPATGNWEIQ